MANQSTILIELKVDDKGSATIKQFGTEAETSLKGVESSTDKTSSAADRLKDTWTDLAVKGAAAWMAVTKAMALMDDGAKAVQVESSFKIMAESSGAMADTMIANMKAAARETIDDSDLMQKAIKLLTLGYDPAEIERFSGVVITASQIAGTTAVEAYDRLSDAIANRMPKALVAMGGVTKDQMKVVTDALASGATQSDLLGLALSNLELKQLMLKGTSDDAAVSMQKLHALIGETKETIGKGLIVAVDALYRSLEFYAGGVLGVVAAYASYRAIVYEAMGDETKATANREVATAAWGARNELITRASKAIFDNSVADQKATTQELTAAKTRAAAAEARMKFIATEGMTEAELAAAKQKQIEEVKKAQDEANKNWLEGAETVAKVAADVVKQNDEDLKFFEQMEKDKVKALEKEMEGWRKAGDTAVDEMEKEIARGFDASKATLERNEKRGEAEREIYKDLRGYEDQYFAASKTLIDAQAEKYRGLGVDEVAVAAWVTQELAKEDIKKGKSSNDFMAGVNAGIAEMKLNAIGFGTVGYETFKTFSDSSAKAFGSNFRDILKGDFSNLGEAWKTVGENMLTTFTDNLGKMASQKITELMQPAWDAFSGMFTTAGTGIWDTLKSGYSGAIDLMGDTGIVGYLQSGWDSFKGLFSTAGSGIWDTLKGGYSGAVDLMGDTGIVGYLQSGWDSFKGLFSTAGSGIWDTLKSGYSGAIDLMGDTGIVGYLQTGWDSFKGLFTTAGTGIWDTLKSGYSGVISTLGSTSIVSSTWQSWKDFAGDAGKWIGNIWTSFTGLLSSMAGVDIKGWLRPAWDAFSGFFSNGASGIWDVIKSGYSTVVKALSESDLTMNFVATVSGAWNSILALINKGWDLASGLDWSFSQGGMVPGYASGGDSPTNDTVLARVSPREYIEPRSAVNSETIGMLEYIRQNKALPYGYFEGGYIPGYADGGLVDTWKGMLGDYRMPFKPTSRLDEVFASQNVSTNDSGMSSIGGWNLYDGTNGRKGQLYLDKQEAEAGIISPKYPVWSEQIGDNLKRIYYYDGSTEESEMSVGMGWWQEFLERWGAKLTMTLAAAAITYGVGSGVGAALGATAGGVAGAGAGGLMGYMSGKGEGGWLSAIIGAVGGAVGGYYSGGGGDLGEIVSDMAGAAKYNAVIGAGGTLADAGAAYDVAFKAAMLSQGIDSVLNFAEKYGGKYLAKWAIGEVVNAMEGGGKGGSASLNFDGESGGFSSASAGMGQIAPKDSSFSFSALNGLDYVPRDNFRINAHEGEAVLTKPQAEDWRGGKGGENTYIFNLYSTVTDTKTFKGFAKDIMHEISRIESRQITVGAN